MGETTPTKPCPSCRGTGADPMSDNVNWLPCSTCHGRKVVPEMDSVQPAERERLIASVRRLMLLPDGSGFAVMSFPLPEDHWLYTDDGFEPPPMTYRLGTNDPERKAWEVRIRAAVQYAVRAATMKGKEPDFDPDALVQNAIVGMLGYYTPTGLSSDDFANPRTSEAP